MKNEGYCLKCAKELKLKPIDDMMQKMGINDEDLDNLTSEMQNALGSMEDMSDLSADSDDTEEPDAGDEGKTATFPFLNRLFGNGRNNNLAASADSDASDARPGGQEREQSAKDGGKKDGKNSKRKFLDNYCISLTNRAIEGKLDNIIGRDEEIQRVIQILNRRQKNNPCLIGEPGVGKTAIAEGLAQRIVAGQVPYKLRDKEVHLLDLTALVAGTQFRGQFESRMKGLIEEVKRLGNIILVIDEIHNIAGAGEAEGSMNAANILKPALSRGEIQVIGATTFTEYRKYIEKDTALERRFQPVTVNEPSIADTVEIIKGIAHYYEEYHKVVIPEGVARQAVVMSERYITDRYLPDKAIDLIDEACSDVNLHNTALTRIAEIEKELADLAKEKEVMLAAVADEDERLMKRKQDLERRQQQARRELYAIEQARISMFQSEMDDQTAQRLEQNNRRRKEIEEKLNGYTEERNQLEAQSDNRAYARLAEIRSMELRLEDEKLELEARELPRLSVENLARVIEQWTKIPASKIQQEEFSQLAELDTRLKQHIIGQDEAVDAVSAAIRRNRVGISPKHKPVSFIFVGSTGVGKTELVKQLANDLFDSPDALIRLDMSEFMERHTVSRLIGSPPGYVGYDEAGQLTEKIRRKPYSVVLFDELEKAHPDVLNILLQILDDGEITDAQGRKVNFENTVIVMTSNVGSEKKESSLGFNRSAAQASREKCIAALNEFLRPEFINRVDEIICFNRLTEENFKAITRIMLDELVGSLAEKAIDFSYDDKLVEYLSQKSYSEIYGARNLRREIQKSLEDVIASRIIYSYQTPVSVIHASANEEGVVLTSR
ncbi:MAG: ATP-dependent Clp protease ATP-binding subunit [Oscillospiraceae bacterium]|nr:ATP-dependent Clp protease ATP-binding subunit [Oscillospiraceae bacterium]